MAVSNNRQYQYSNAAVRLGEVEDPQLRKLTGGRHHRGTSLGYVFFVTAALIFTALVLVHYISLRGDITNRVQHIAALEAQLNEMKLENDATYSRINSNMDLAKIRDTAINELGMTYAKEGQIESFTSENGDYVRQLSDIDKK
ncbi:MAG: cell division protein FtsL [Lachnospiraceae bacterium]|nr:cell division protein FtsL [Lachnospiraceae bacterium]